MLDRVALHQTRLRTPGISLDAKGIALGAKGLVLLPSLDRLVGFLALYSSSAPLTDILGSLSIDITRSKLGNREVLLSFNAEGSDRMDRVAELARLSGGYSFTGTSRHFVQYRDAAAPFGYDVREIAPTDSPVALYHSSFTQHYDYERKIDLAKLLLRLGPRVAPSTIEEEGPRWICAEAGLALDNALVRVAREMRMNSPEMADEMELTSAELGFMSERRIALENLYKRTNLPAMQALANTLIQSERYGTPLAQSLRVLSRELRDERLMKAEEKAARLPATLTVPMMIFIMPTLFIVLIGPGILRAIDGLGGVLK